MVASVKGDKAGASKDARPVEIAAPSTPEVMEVEKDGQKDHSAVDAVPRAAETPAAESTEATDSSLEEKPSAECLADDSASPHVRSLGVADPSTTGQTIHKPSSDDVKEQCMEVNDAAVPEQANAMDVDQKSKIICSSILRCSQSQSFHPHYC